MDEEREQEAKSLEQYLREIQSILQVLKRKRCDLYNTWHVGNSAKECYETNAVVVAKNGEDT